MDVSWELVRLQSSRRLRVGFHRPSAKQGITNARRHETWNDCTAPQQETLLVERKTVGTKLWIWQRLGCLERDDRVRIWNVPRSTTSNKGLVVRRGAFAGVKTKHMRNQMLAPLALKTSSLLTLCRL